MLNKNHFHVGFTLAAMNLPFGHDIFLPTIKLEYDVLGGRFKWHWVHNINPKIMLVNQLTWLVV